MSSGRGCSRTSAPQSQAPADWALGLAEQQASLRPLVPCWSDFFFFFFKNATGIDVWASVQVAQRDGRAPRERPLGGRPHSQSSLSSLRRAGPAFLCLG